MKLLSEDKGGQCVAETLAKEFGCSERSGWRDIKWARERLARLYEKLDREVYQVEILNKAERLYQRCIEKGRLGEALGALKLLAELYGVAPHQQAGGLPVAPTTSRPEREGRPRLRAIMGGKGPSQEHEKPTGGGGNGVGQDTGDG